MRKTSQAALLVLLEQGLVDRGDVEEQVKNQSDDGGGECDEHGDGSGDDGGESVGGGGKNKFNSGKNNYKPSFSFMKYF